MHSDSLPLRAIRLPSISESRELSLMSKRAKRRSELFSVAEDEAERYYRDWFAITRDPHLLH